MTPDACSTSCQFCIKFGRDGRGRDVLFDHVLWEDEDLVVVPAIGGFVPGYVLIIPREHVPSVALLASGMVRRIETVKAMVRAALTPLFGAPVFFEHGPVAPSNASGSCVQHVHVHCLPTDVDLLPALRERHGDALRPLSDYSNITRLATLRQSYIFYETGDGAMFVFSDERLPSQYLRRLFAAKLGFDGVEWDYAVFPFRENAQRTVDALARVAWPSTS